MACSHHALIMVFLFAPAIKGLSEVQLCQTQVSVSNDIKVVKPAHFYNKNINCRCEITTDDNGHTANIQMNLTQTEINCGEKVVIESNGKIIYLMCSWIDKNLIRINKTVPFQKKTQYTLVYTWIKQLSNIKSGSLALRLTSKKSHINVTCYGEDDLVPPTQTVPVTPTLTGGQKAKAMTISDRTRQLLVATVVPLLVIVIISIMLLLFFVRRRNRASKNNVAEGDPDDACEVYAEPDTLVNKQINNKDARKPENTCTETNTKEDKGTCLENMYSIPQKNNVNIERKQREMSSQGKPTDKDITPLPVPVKMWQLSLRDQTSQYEMKLENQVKSVTDQIDGGILRNKNLADNTNFLYVPSEDHIYSEIDSMLITGEQPCPAAPNGSKHLVHGGSMSSSVAREESIMIKNPTYVSSE